MSLAGLAQAHELPVWAWLGSVVADPELGMLGVARFTQPKVPDVGQLFDQMAGLAQSYDVFVGAQGAPREAGGGGTRANGP